MIVNRCDRIVQNMLENNVKQLIITSPPDMYYATGHFISSGERLQALYLNSDGTKKLIVNEVSGRLELSKDIEVIYFNDNDDPVKLLLSFINTEQTLAIDKNWPAHFLIELLEKNSNIKFISSSSIIDKVRMIKDKHEIDLLRNAGNVVDKVMEDIIGYLEKGVSERAAAKKLREFFEAYGTYEYSFEPIIAYGSNCADPHHGTDDTMPKDGDSVIIDIGGITNYYCSDITRTVFFGEPSKEARKIYDIVLEANLRALDKIKPGVLFSDIDNAARAFIEKSGYGSYFTHRTGHCIGIEDHEFPSVSGNNHMAIEEGMAFSVEPGIYLPGKYGVRIGDIVVVTSNGKEVLNKVSKDFRSLKI